MNLCERMCNLLNPFRHGKAGAALADDMLSYLAILGATPTDEQGFRDWVAAKYFGGKSWMVGVTTEGTATFTLGTSSGGIDIWWGDDTTEVETPGVASKTYSGAADRPVVMIGHLTSVSASTGFRTRPLYLPRSLLTFIGASSAVVAGSVADLPAGLTTFDSSDSVVDGSTIQLPRDLAYFRVGDGSVIIGDVAELPEDLQQLILPDTSKPDGATLDLPRSLTRLDLPNSEISGSVADLPTGLTRLVLRGSGMTVDGSTSGLPSGLTYLALGGANAVTGGMSGLPAGLVTLILDGSTSISGAAADLPSTLVNLDLLGSTVLTGDVADLPSGLERVVLAASGHTISGAVGDLPATIEYAYLGGSNTVGGNLSGLSSHAALINLSLYGNNTVTGDLASLPDQLLVLAAWGSNTISGDLSDLPSSLVDINLRGGAVVTLATPSLPTGLSAVDLRGVIASDDSDSVDNFLEAMWTNRDEAKPISTRSITILARTGGLATPGPTSTTHLDLLRAYRSPGNSSQFLLWTVTTEEPVLDVDVEVVNIGVSNLSIQNRTTHQYTYNFESTEQDGTVVCLVLFLGDQGALSNVKTPVTTGLTKIIETEHVDGGGWYGYYVPSQGDLDTGSILFRIDTSTLQVWQFVVMELRNADLSDLPTSLVADMAYSGSHDDRTSVTAGTLSVDKPGSLMVASSSSDDTFEDHPGMSPDQGFTTVATWDGFPGMPGFHVASKLATTTGELATPTFTLSASDEQNVLAVAIRGISASGGGGGPTEGGEVTALAGGDPSYLEGVTQIAKDLPAYEVGDTLLAVVFHRSTLTPASGWSLVAIQTNDSPTAVHFVSVYRKDMLDTSETTATWQQASSGRMGAAYVIARSNTDDPIVIEDVVGSFSQVAGSPYEHPVPAVETTVDGSVVLAISTCSNAPTTTTTPYAVPADEEALGWQQLTPDEQLLGRIALSILPVPTAGAVAATAFEHFGVSAHHTAEIALVLAPSGDPTPSALFAVMEAEDFL